MDFKTKIKPSVYGLSRYLTLENVDFDVTGTLAVEWALEIEARDWGIKSITTSIKSITGDIEWECDGELLTDEERATLKSLGAFEDRSGTFSGVVSITPEWEIDFDLEVKSDTISPTEVNIDFGKKQISVE